MLRDTTPPMLFRLTLLLAALAFPLSAQESSPHPALPATTVASSPSLDEIRAAARLEVARNGDEVLVTWSLPPADYKGVDVYRNIQERTSGRSRVDFVGATPAEFRDKVPDASVTYWYWLKVVLRTGEHINIGPVKTPDAAVWTP